MFAGSVDVRHDVEILLQASRRAEASRDLRLGLDESECSLGQIVVEADCEVPREQADRILHPAEAFDQGAFLPLLPPAPSLLRSRRRRRTLRVRGIEDLGISAMESFQDIIRQ